MLERIYLGVLDEGYSFIIIKVEPESPTIPIAVPEANAVRPTAHAPQNHKIPWNSVLPVGTTERD
jgi:hypothetical protein